MALHSSTLAWKIPWGREELDTTEPLHFHYSLSCIGEGNGTPLQYSCLENPRDGSLVGCRLWGHTESDTTDVIQQQQQHLTTKIKKKKKILHTITKTPHAATKNQWRHIDNIFFKKSKLYWWMDKGMRQTCDIESIIKYKW